jgi:hypothetical protein
MVHSELNAASSDNFPSRNPPYNTLPVSFDDCSHAEYLAAHRFVCLSNGI